MTFAEPLATPRPLAELRELWLVLDAPTAAAFEAQQAEHGSAVNRISPIAGPASDPRFALCADLITEIGEGGMHAHLFSHLNAAAFSAVAILSRAELESLGWFAAQPDSI